MKIMRQVKLIISFSNDISVISMAAISCQACFGAASYKSTRQTSVIPSCFKQSWAPAFIFIFYVAKNAIFLHVPSSEFDWGRSF